MNYTKALSIFFFLGSYIFQSHAMYNTVIKELTSKKVSLTKNKFLHSTPVRTHIYGAVLMKNRQRNQTAVFLPDVHISRSDSIISFEQLNEVQKQQEEVIALAQKLQCKHSSAHMLVEDKISLLKKMGSDSDIVADPGIVFQSFLTNTYSPLILLEQLCKVNNISCTNIEFRNEEDVVYQEQVKKQIRERVDAEIIAKLSNYHRHYQELKNDPDVTFIDAQVIAHSNEIKKPNAVTIVCAGASHIRGAAKILYQQGYSTTNVITSEKIPVQSIFSLQDFKADMPLVCNKEFVEHIPKPLPNLSSAVLQACDHLD